MSFLDTADAHSIAEQVRTARLSPGRVAEHFLTQASARESAIQAFVALDPQVVRKQAQGLSSPGINGLLAGVPIGVKDIIDTRDHPTGFYSPIYDNNWPSRDAHVVALLRQAGAVIMGKTHTTEFAYMHTGPTRNPVDLSRTPGSSSAGSAAGMGAGFFPLRWARKQPVHCSSLRLIAVCMRSSRHTGWCPWKGSNPWRRVSTRWVGTGAQFVTWGWSHRC